MIENENFLLRRTRREDCSELNDVYRKVTGIVRSESSFFWEWFEGPFGANDSFVIVDKRSKKVVGHHGVVQVPLKIGNLRVRGGRTENSMLLPDFRQTIPYFLIEKHILEEQLTKFDVIFTTAGKGNQKLIRQRLGYQDLGKWRHLILNDGSFQAVTRRILGPKAKNLMYHEYEKNYDERALLKLERSGAFSLCDVEDLHLTSAKRSIGPGYLRAFPDKDYLRWKAYDPVYRKFTGNFEVNGHRFGVMFAMKHWSNGSTDIVIKFISAQDPENALQMIAKAIKKLSGLRLVFRHVYKRLDKTEQISTAIKDMAEPAHLMLLDRTNTVRRIAFDGLIAQD